MRVLLVLAPIALIASQDACAQDAPDDLEIAASDEPKIDAEALRPVPAELDQASRSAVAGINAFSLDLYRRTVAPGGNIGDGGVQRYAGVLRALRL